MSLQEQQLATCLDIPNPGGVVFGSRCQLRTIVIESHGLNRSSMTSQGKFWIPCIGVKEKDQSIIPT